MILRRLTQSLKEQNWTAIWIEFVLLVAGVFLGIQVSNWNSAQIEKREARESMQRLENDLRLSIQLTQLGIDHMTTVARGSDRVFHRLRACSLPEGERNDFASGLYGLGKILPARLVRTTFDELRDSGRLGLIGDADLRRDLDDSIRKQESHETVFRLIATRMDPHIAYLDSNVIYDIDDTIGGTARIGWNRVDVDFDAACKDRRFLAAVASIRNYTYDNLTDVMGRQRSFKKLLAMVEKANAR
jgi:hypothetical protein